MLVSKFIKVNKKKLANMKIFVGADHNGYQSKGKIIEFLQEAGYEVVDVGNDVYDPADDFPVFANRAVKNVLNSNGSDRAILICGGGQGMAMAANRHKGIRASVIWDSEEARLTRNDNDSNVLALPARIAQSNPEVTQQIITTWLEGTFAAEDRYIRRNKMLDSVD